MNTTQLLNWLNTIGNLRESYALRGLRTESLQDFAQKLQHSPADVAVSARRLLECNLRALSPSMVTVPLGLGLEAIVHSLRQTAAEPAAVSKFGLYSKVINTLGSHAAHSQAFSIEPLDAEIIASAALQHYCQLTLILLGNLESQPSPSGANEGESSRPPHTDSVPPPEGESDSPTEGESALPPEGESALPPEGESALPPEGESDSPPEAESEAPVALWIGNVPQDWSFRNLLACLPKEMERPLCQVKEQSKWQSKDGKEYKVSV